MKCLVEVKINLHADQGKVVIIGFEHLDFV